jgi:integrase
VRNNLDPLRVIFREALEDGQITLDPTVRLTMPLGSGRRDRVADRGEAQQLIDALPATHQAFWACAFYGGLRRGELRALRWDDVDLGAAGAIHVRRSWDDKEGDVATKTVAGERTVPLAGVLRRLLVTHKVATGRSGTDLVFGRTRTEPFIPSTLRYQAHAVWEKAGLKPISPHEARHSAASYLIEAGLNDLELTATIGHSDPRTTKAIYGHLFPDSRKVITGKMDAYLDAHAGSGGA